MVSITKHPEVADYFLIDGDPAAFPDHYDRDGVIVVRRFPLDFDLALFQQVTFPPKWKKIGTINGLERPFEESPLANVVEVGRTLHSQITAVNAQIRATLRDMFPAFPMKKDNITWRLTETGPEAMHFDVVTGTAKKRLKAFINIDAEPRHWRMSHRLTEAAAALSMDLPTTQPERSRAINSAPGFQNLPAHDVLFPALTAIICNGETIAHQVVRGRRCIAFESLG